MERARVVLYNPRAVFYTMPLALVAIGSALDPARYDVRIIDARIEADPIGALLEALDGALCLGVTALTGAPLHDALAASRAAKARNPELPVIWGGWHPSLFPLATLDEAAIDVTVQAQGEVSFTELVERLADGRSIHGVAGTGSRPNGIPTQHPPRPLTPMDALPPHRFELLDVEAFFRLKQQRQIDYISSTGCHFRCAFCADPFVYGRKWVGLAPERVVDEIAGLWERYRFDDLAFQDETFFTYRKRVAAIAEGLIERDLPITWTATLRADQGFRLSDEIIALCARSGLRRVMIGVEAGSQPMLDWMKKDITIEQILDSAEKCVRHGIGAIFPLIVGFPGESEESVRASLDFVKRLRAMSPDFETPIFYFKPYPGSEITAEAVRRGYRLPTTLEGWAEFDFVGSAGPWVTPETYRLVERFKFYNRFAWGPETRLRWPLQRLARWRCRRDFFAIPLEKLLVERLKPLPRLS